MDHPYFPISCAFHDQLLHYATLGESVILKVLDRGMTTEFQTRIMDVFTKDGAEYIALENQPTYRLDQILSVNGLELKGQSCDSPA